MIPQNDYMAVVPSEGKRDFQLLGDRIGGLGDSVTALENWILTVLSTERGGSPIFSRDFGLNLKFGSGVTDAELIHAITEALTRDARIRRVEDFTITRERGSISAAFTVHSVYGALRSEMNQYV